MNRRRFIKLIGGGGAIVAAAGVALTQCDQMPAEAIAGWTGRGESDPRRGALAHAILAPNPHNMQLWIADLGVAGEADSFADGGGGPGGDLAKPSARIRLSTGGGAMRKDPLFAQIPKRRSNKEPYDPARAVTAAHARQLASAVDGDALRFHLARLGDQFQSVKDIARRAMLQEMQIPRTHKESIDRLRIGAKAIAKRRDGTASYGWMSAAAALGRHRAELTHAQ